MSRADSGLLGAKLLDNSPRNDAAAAAPRSSQESAESARYASSSSRSSSRSSSSSPPSSTMTHKRREPSVAGGGAAAAAAAASSESSFAAPPEKAPTPLPVLRLLVLMLVQMNEAIMIVYVTPFVPFMIASFLELDDTQDPRVAQLSGFLVTVFPVAQALSSHLWGNLSDRYGRRPIILIGIVGNLITIPLFGCSQNLYWAFFTRALCGLLNGNVALAKTYLSEILDKSNQAKGFAMFSLSFAAGLALGPVFGGVLYDYPKIESGFFATTPWLKPSLAAATVSVVALVIAVPKLDETYFPNKDLKNQSRDVSDKPPKKVLRSSSDSAAADSDKAPLISVVANRDSAVDNSGRSPRYSYGSYTHSDVTSAVRGEVRTPDVGVHISTNRDSVFAVGGEPNLAHRTEPKLSRDRDEPKHPKKVSTESGGSTVTVSVSDHSSADGKPAEKKESILRELWNNKPYVISVGMFTLSAIMPISMSALMPLWFSLPVSDGGWEWDPFYIGVVQATGAGGIAFMNLVFYPKLTKRYGLIRVFQCVWILPIILLLCWPTFIYMEGMPLQFTSMLFVQFFLSMGFAGAFTSTNILTANTVYREILGTSNGIAQAVSSCARAAGPSLCGVLFSVGLSYENDGGALADIPLFNRHLPFYVIALAEICNILLSTRIPKEYHWPQPPKLRYANKQANPDD